MGLKRSPLRPGKPLQRGGPLQVRTRLERRTPLAKRNAARLAKLRAAQFADQAAVCRELPCAFCGHPPPSTPHHVVRRGAGGGDEWTVPACTDCHRLIHDKGNSWLPIGHAALASLLHETLSLLVPAPPVPEFQQEEEL
jgi:hypothetical protein